MTEPIIGRYFFPGAARFVPARAFVQDDSLRVEDENGGVLAPVSRDYVEISPRLGKLPRRFKLLDEGRLKPLHAVNVIALGAPNPGGGREYKVNARFELKPTSDGHRAGQLQIPSECVEGAFLHFLAKRVDGRPRPGVSAAYYDVPLKRFVK